MTTSSVTVTPIGHTGKAYRVDWEGGVVQVRTRSPRRYLVIDLRNGSIYKRTDNRATAEKTAWRGGAYTYVLDTREVR